MSIQCPYFLMVGIFVDTDSIETITMSDHQLFTITTNIDIGYLTACLYFMNQLVLMDVEYLY